MGMRHYRIKRTREGRYEVHRKAGFFWIHDGGDRRLKSRNKSDYFNYWYDTYERAKRGVDARYEFDKKLLEENGPLGEQIFYYPFPETDI